MTRNSASALTAISRAALFLTLGVPMVLAPGFLFPFVSVRGLVFRALIAIAGTCLLLRALSAEKAERGSRDWTFVALIILLAVSTVSAAFGYSWQRSVFGTLARLGGVWTLANLFLFYILLRIAFEERHWRWYLRGIVLVGLLAATYGMLQRYQVALGISWEGSPHPPNGPLGNFGIFAGYLLFPIAAACYLAVSEDRRGLRSAAAAALAPLVWMLWLTTNRSSVLGLFAGTMGAVVLYSWYSGRGRRLALSVIVVGLAAVAMVASMRPGRPLDAWGPRMPTTIRRFINVAPVATGLDRRLQWRAATLAARDRPLLGYGPENHEIVWTRHFDPTIYTLTEDRLWDRTHNAYFEAVGTTGFLGLAALLFLWGAILAAIESRRREGSLDSAEAAVLVGINAAYAVYLWFWFYDLTAMAAWIALAAFVSSRGRASIVSLSGTRPWRVQSLVIGAATVAVAASLIWTHSLAPLFESRKLGALQAWADGKPAEPTDVLREFRSQFASTSAYGAPALTFFSRYLGSLRPAFPRLQQDSAFVRELAPTLQQALLATERARAADPLNDRLMTVKSRLMIRASQFYDSPEINARAEATAREAVALGPRRVGPRLVLASVLLANNRLREALAQTDSALAIFPGSTESHGVRAAIFLALEKPDSAGMELRAAMPPADTSYGARTLPRTDPAFVLRTAFALAETGDHRGSADLLQHYMTRWYGEFSQWGRGTSESLASVRLDRAIASMLPVLRLHAGELQSARAAALAFAAVCGPARSIVADFIASSANPAVARARYPHSVTSRSADLAEIISDVTRTCEPGRPS